MKKFETIIQLKKSNKTLGLKNFTYYITDIQYTENNEIKYTITPAIFTGLGIGIGKSSFILNELQMKEYFKNGNITLQEYRKQSMNKLLKVGS